MIMQGPLFLLRHGDVSVFSARGALCTAAAIADTINLVCEGYMMVSFTCTDLLKLKNGA
jgi:hypothetical protein